MAAEAGAPADGVAAAGPPAAAVAGAVVVVATEDSPAAAEVPEEEAPVRVGKLSRIVQAIGEAEIRTTGEIRVHLSKRWFEQNPLHRARKIFHKFGMQRTSNRNAVLLYVNLRRKRLAIYGDEAVHDNVGQQYWDKIAKELSQDLRSTHHENAIAIAVRKIGNELAKHFPCDSTHQNHHELSPEVTSD